ncbi:type II CAAX endopeptidase family protein [Paenibacillus pinisoli]|nr:type II CAAX endopeptidase family protein [Paenibacillus pinisoli]
MRTDLSNTAVAGMDGEKERIRLAKRGLLVFFAMLVPLTVLGYALALTIDETFVLLLMWAPGLAAILTRLVRREGFKDISLKIGGKRTLKTVPMILLFPVAIGLFAYGIAWLTGLAQFAVPDDSFDAPPAVVFIGILLMQLTVGTLAGLFGAAGEEIGWRGYMITRMVDARVPKPMLTSGIIWGVWHLPVMILGAYYSGPNLALSILLFMFSVTSFSYILSRLRLTTGSVWPAIFLHASWNAVTQDVFDAFSKGENALLWTGESGILVALALLGAAWLMSRKPMSMRHL